MQSLCLTFALLKLALTSLVLVLATAPHCTGRLIEKRSTGQQIKTIVSLFLAWTVFALSPEQFDVRFLGLKKLIKLQLCLIRCGVSLLGFTFWFLTLLAKD